MTADATAFLANYQKRLAELAIRANLAQWKAANTGTGEDFDSAAETMLALRQFHGDADAYNRVKTMMEASDELSRLQARALQVAELSYKRNQLPPDLLKQIVDLSTDIERISGTFRAELDGRRLSNNELLTMLEDENDPRRRERIWKSLKQVGGAVGPKLLELAVLRNKAARKLGFDNFWQMKVRLQEYDPQQLLTIFEELDRLTRDPFAKVKGEMDVQLAARFSVKPEEILPWHFDNPFFQDPPPSKKIDLNEFYEKKTKEDIVEISRVFFAAIGLPVEGVLRRSDLYEREGKDQHAFCTSINHADDVRILCNVKPTASWMDTTLHELGHAVYDLGIDQDLPFNLREPAAIFTTEGVAMLLGALGKNPVWMVTCAGADKARVDKLTGAILEQRRREQLVFARWAMVMLHFEKALYENPHQDLNKLWWDYVERYQLLKRPPGRDEPDWAAKPHFTIAPAYYHNYMLGELFASQVRHALAKQAGHKGPSSQLQFNDRKDFGEFLKKNVFAPGSLMPWPEFVEQAVGEPLTAKYFAEEIGRP